MKWKGVSNFFMVSVEKNTATFTLKVNMCFGIRVLNMCDVFWANPERSVEGEARSPV